MEEQRLAVYLPDEDRRVTCREELRVQRVPVEAAVGERFGDGLPAEVLRYRVYRITAQPVASVRDQPLIRCVFAGSEGAAVEHPQATFSRSASLYEDCGYRIISVDQVLPEPGAFP
ncbi:hypothetical protein [Streptomyces sp. NBC_00212]|uniref:hypothetical protein n=1 Tax=Streptomyces sp. NBC_00212 TaxID=2975684 RepID=UPI002F919B9E